MPENPVEDPIVETPGSAEEPPKTTNDAGIEVVIGEETPPAPTPEPPKPPAPDPLVSLRNKTFAQDRIISTLKRQNEEISNTLTEVSKTLQEIRAEREQGLFRGSAVTGQEDDVDKLVKEGNWKKGVEILAERVASAKIAKLTEQQKAQIEKDKTAGEFALALNTNIKRVEDKHPDLLDPTTEKSVIFAQILDENPRWRNSPDGPLLAMYEMEQRLNPAAKPQVPMNPQAPPVRPAVNPGGLPPSKPANGGNKVFLTQEQKQLCDDNNIPYEEYAKSLAMMNRGEGKVGISV